MNIKNYTDIPFGTDSELMEEEISIPDGFEAVIEGNKIILKKVECDDERVKNRLIKLIKMSSEVGGFALHKWEADEMLAWLEKQGEQKPTLPKWKYKKDNTTLLKDSLVLNKCGHMAKLSSGAIVSDVWVLDYDELAKLPKEELEEQGEQNPTDNVEPKFKVGDWIVNRLGNIWHIDSFDAKNYQVTNTKGEHNYFPINIQDRMHLWTIADAKPGDVLATEPIDAYPSPFVAIYKIRRPDYFNSYCLIRFDGKFYEADTGHSIENIYPATKEQRDTLFTKMKESGYEWDSEKKELKKIEQKPADNVEPKFHIGDCVVDNCGYVWKIEGILNQFYILEGIEGGESRPTIEWVNKNFHLWTIDDAKDGDMLAERLSSGRTIIIIYNGLNEEDTILSHCGYNGSDFVVPKNGIGFGHLEFNLYTPATKEQRDLLFEKMHEARYEWDAEKKELEKIDNEEVNGEDYGIDGLWHAQRILEKTLGSVDGYQTDDGILDHKAAITAVKKLYKQKLAWSEEDEEMLKSIMATCELAEQERDSSPARHLLEMQLNWLKSLRPQNRDTYNPYKEVVSSIAEMCDKYKSFSDDRANDFVNNVKVKCKDAKEYDSIYPQNTWLPSDEQMESLEQFISEYKDIDDSNRAYPISHIIESLYNDLKKLKGE